MAHIVSNRKTKTSRTWSLNQIWSPGAFCKGPGTKTKCCVVPAKTVWHLTPGGVAAALLEADVWLHIAQSGIPQTANKVHYCIQLHKQNNKRHQTKYFVLRRQFLRNWARSWLLYRIAAVNLAGTFWDLKFRPCHIPHPNFQQKVNQLIFVLPVHASVSTMGNRP